MRTPRDARTFNSYLGSIPRHLWRNLPCVDGLDTPSACGGVVHTILAFKTSWLGVFVSWWLATPSWCLSVFVVNFLVSKEAQWSY